MKAKRDQHEHSADYKPLDPNRPPLQSAKLGSRFHDEAEPNPSVTNNPPTAVTWEWQHSTAPGKGPEPAAPVKGPEPQAPAQEGTSTPEHEKWTDATYEAEMEHSLWADRKLRGSTSKVDEGPWTEDDFIEEEINRSRSTHSFEDWTKRMDIMNEIYARYRLVGGLRKFKPEDHDGTEYYYDQWPNIVLEEGDWHEDFNNLPPNELYEDDDYIRWYRSTHPKPTSLREAIRNWLDRRQQLARRRECNPGTYERHLRDNDRGVKPRADGRNPDIWDDGALYRSHMIRQQAAMDLEESSNDRIFVNEQDIDNHLIWSVR
jgi:hypothetical protein